VERQVSAKHAVLERYLNLATRGLWGQKKLEVRRELDGNIREMALEYFIAGLNEHDSIQRALEEFGAPQKVSVGMSKVYFLPSMIRNVVLALTISSLTVSVFNSSSAQVTGTNRYPTPKCLNSDVKSVQFGSETIDCESSQFWIDTISLRQVLEPLGVKFEESQYKILIRFPGTTSSMIFNRDYGNTLMDLNGNILNIDLDPQFIFASDFFNQLRAIGLPVALNGWDNTQITVGQTRFSLGATQAKVSGDIIYPDVLSKLLPNFWSEQKPDDKLLYVAGQGMLGNPGSVVTNPHQIKLNTSTQAAYVVLTREPGPVSLWEWNEEANRNGNFSPEKIYSEFRLTRILTNDATGVLKFASNAKTLEFIDDPKSLKTVTRNGTGQAVLLRFTGHLEVGSTAFEVVPAKQFSITKK
jgi:hypothetical protein